MQYPLQPQLAIIGARRQQRFAPVMRTVTSSYVKEEKVRLGLVLAFFVCHVPLAVLMSKSTTVATLHLLVTLGGALWLAVSSEKIERVAYAAAYITGAEVLWRMTGAQSIWEIGKYGVAAVLLAAMVRHWRAKPSIFPVLYFALLVPSAFLTISDLPLYAWRQALSSNLSGPFALLVVGCFFSQVTLTREKLLRLLLILTGPVIAVAAVAFFDIATADAISFGNASNFATSGSFGPNQVSAILGLGAFASFQVLLSERADIRMKLLAGGSMIFLTAQSILTFSRGGLYNLVGAILLSSIFILKDARTRVQFVLAVLLIGGFSYFVVFPRLDAFTNGALSARFEDTGTTGRDDVVESDLNIWHDNPVWGVGPGMASVYRSQQMGVWASSHTEFSRLLAEHGIFGLAALLVFLAAIGRNFMKAESAQQKALVVGLSGWSILYMLNAGMRLVAPSMIFGLAFAHFLPAKKSLTELLTEWVASKKPQERMRYSKSPAYYPQQSRRVL